MNIQVYNEYGPIISGGRGTIEETSDMNMKGSQDPLVLYYPHDTIPNAPITKPILAGQIATTYQRYTFFKISSVSTVKISNVRITLGVQTATQASNVRLFYKLVSAYTEPINTFDGSMIPAYTGSAFSNGQGVLSILANLGGTSPASTTVFYPTYTFTGDLYSQYLVTQLVVGPGTVGNSAEFRYSISFDEIGSM